MSNRNNINTDPGNLESFIELTDTPKTYAGSELMYCQVNNIGSGLQFAPASGTGISTFTELLDCPSTYTGSNNYQVVVNPSATGLTFQPNGLGVTKFIECTDTPMTYAGTNSFDIVNVTTAHNALQFTSLPLLAGFTTPITALMDTPGSYGLPGQYLGVNATSTGTTWQSIVPYITENILNITDTTSTVVSIPANSTSPYVINMSYIVLNQGFTITPPIQFSPSLTSTYTIDYSYSFQCNKTTNVTGASYVQVTGYLYQYPSTVVTQLFNSTFPTNTMALTPAYDSHTIVGTREAPMTAGTFYFYRTNITTPSDTAGSFILGQKIFNSGGRLPTLLVNNADYNNAPNPPYGTDGQYIVSDGVNKFSLKTPLITTEADYDNGLNPPYGELNQVLTSDGIGVFSLQTPLLINNGDCPDTYGSAGQVLTSTGSAYTLSTPISFIQTTSLFVDMYEYLWLTYQPNPNNNRVVGSVPIWFTKINNLVTMNVNYANNFILSQILDANSSIYFKNSNTGSYAVVPSAYLPNQLQYPVQNFQGGSCSYLAANQTAPSPPNTPFRPMMCFVWYNTGMINLLNLYNNSSNGAFGNIYFYPMGFSMSWIAA